jgi:hypothetical protein
VWFVRARTSNPREGGVRAGDVTLRRALRDERLGVLGPPLAVAEDSDAKRWR